MTWSTRRVVPCPPDGHGHRDDRRLMPRQLAPLVLLLTACGTAGDPGYSLDVGADDAGTLRFVPSDGGNAGGFDAYIEQNQVAVKFITISCSGDCATVQAVATGGDGPYSYAWDDGSTSATRRVCPAADASYWVKVTDHGTTGDFTQPAQTVRVPLAANVLSCPDASGACVPGMYTGTWTGTGIVDGSAGDATSYVGSQAAPVTAPVTFMFVDSTGDSGTELVPSGTLVLTWDLAAQWTAHLSGGLDCATGAFYANDPMATTTVAGVAAGTCNMTLTGQYDSATESITGPWTSDCFTEDWGGTWTVAWTP